MTKLYRFIHRFYIHYIQYIQSCTYIEKTRKFFEKYGIF